MKYKSKPVIVDAFLWTGGPDQTEDPEWIVEAIANRTVVIQQGPNGCYMELPGMREAITGQYIVLAADGSISAMWRGEFESRFELA